MILMKLFDIHTPRMMTLDCKQSSSFVLVKFKRTLMSFGIEYLRWLKMKMLELEKEFFILFVTAVHKD
jgi:hypothetical protein